MSKKNKPRGRKRFQAAEPDPAPPPPPDKPASTLTKTQKRKLQKKRQAANRPLPTPKAAAANAPLSSLAVLHEDAHVIAINKPAGMPCHGAVAGERGTVVDALAARERTTDFSELASDMLEARRAPTGEADSFIPRCIVHRLDKGTTGLLLVAKTERAEDALGAAFRRHASMSKRYVALLCGRPRASAVGVDASDGGATLHVDAPIGRDPQRPGKMRVAHEPDAKHAQSVVRVHAVSGGGGSGSAGSDGGELCLVTVELLTGRSHQIRVHCAHALGAPLANDDAYGGTRLAGIGRARPMLHAWAMDVQHPAAVDARAPPLCVRAPLPDDMRRLVHEHFPGLPGDDPGGWPLSTVT